MITRGAADTLIAVAVALLAAAVLTGAFLFWWPLVSYAIHYWGI
jgi:hypothetical protein